MVIGPTLNNSNLTGVILGFTLNTKQEELYRAIIEATAFGTRNVIESFRWKIRDLESNTFMPVADYREKVGL